MVYLFTNIFSKFHTVSLRVKQIISNIVNFNIELAMSIKTFKRTQHKWFEIRYTNTGSISFDHLLTV